MRRLLTIVLAFAIIAAGLSYGVTNYNRYLIAEGPNADETIVLLPRGSGLQAIWTKPASSATPGFSSSRFVSAVMTET